VPEREGPGRKRRVDESKKIVVVCCCGSNPDMEHSREQQQKQQQQQAAAAAALHRRVATIVRHISMPISSSSSYCQKQQQLPCSKQLLPVSDQQQIHVELCSCSSSGSETSERRRPSNKYERLHGSVSRELPVWTQPVMLSGPPFEDILYEKAQDEAIAKVTMCVFVRLSKTLV
jgi:hypothetical protein